MTDFFEDTFVGRFGDERLAKRARSLAAKMAAAETSVVRRLASGRAETTAFGRFLDNEAVTTAGIFSAAGAATAKPQTIALNLVEVVEIGAPARVEPVSSRDCGAC